MKQLFHHRAAHPRRTRRQSHLADPLVLDELAIIASRRSSAAEPEQAITP